MTNGHGGAAGTVRQEGEWTAEEIASRLWKFYRERTSTRAVTRLAFVEHIAYLLFLKLDHERSQRGGRLSASPVAPAGTWPRLAGLSGDDLHSALRDLMDDLGMPAPQDALERETASVLFRDAQPWNVERMAELSSLIVEEIAPYHWSSVRRPELGRAFDLLLLDCRNDIDAKIHTGQTLTPRPILRVVARALDVRPGDMVIDPACGTGSTLIAAQQVMASQEGEMGPASIAGADLDAQMCRLATMNILLGTGRPFREKAPVRQGDSLLAQGVPVRRSDSTVVPTVAICNPPFKSTSTPPNSDLRTDFWAFSDFPTNFLQHIAITLPIGARAAVFLPDGVLFGSNSVATIRRRLLQNCDVHTLLRLPTGLFHRKGVKANVLFFTKAAPKPSGEPATRTLWVYDARSDTHHTDTGNPVTEADFDGFLTAYRPEGGFAARTESDRFRPYDAAQLLDRADTNLNLYAHIKPDLVEFEAPRDIALRIADDLGEAQRHFQAVAERLE
ncbi:N-6 DNA methylase [Streptomyces sp. PmtA]|uniref:HsdM family class I SAM-dependent methyltransferase n=1 Tax=Streptomyces sp. PmtA TaxID=3074275 RepID=UPI003014997F